MSVRSHPFKKRHDQRETPYHESREERFQRQRAEHEDAHPPPTSPLQKIKSMFRPRTERPVEREDENPEKQPQKVYTPPPRNTRPQQAPTPAQAHRQVKKPVRTGAIGLLKKFGHEFAEGGKEVIKDIRKRQDREGGVDAALGDFIGVKGSGRSGGKQRINENGYIEILGRDGTWIFTGKKARFKIPKTGYDEATGLEYEAEQDEEGEHNEDKGLYNFTKSGKTPRDHTRGSRRQKNIATFPQGGIPPQFAQPQSAPAWQTGVSGLTGRQQEPMGAREPIIGAGLAVMSTGMFPNTYGNRQPAAQPLPMQRPGKPAQPRQERESGIGAGISIMSSGMFPMTYGSPKPSPPTVEIPQEYTDIEVPPAKLSKKKRKQLEAEMTAMLQQRAAMQQQQQPPAKKSSQYSAFEEVFGSSGLRL